MNARKDPSICNHALPEHLLGLKGMNCVLSVRLDSILGSKLESALPAKLGTNVQTITPLYRSCMPSTTHVDLERIQQRANKSAATVQQACTQILRSKIRSVSDAQVDTFVRKDQTSRQCVQLEPSDESKEVLSKRTAPSARWQPMATKAARRPVSHVRTGNLAQLVQTARFTAHTKLSLSPLHYQSS